MTSKENESSTKIDTAAVVDPEVTKSINEIIDDVLDKVDKVVIDDIPEKIDLDNEKNDAFEIIAYPKTMTESKIDSVDAKVNDYLDTIEENDLTDTTNSLEMTLDEGMHIVNDDDYAHIDDPVDVKSLTDDSVSRKIAVGDGINRYYDVFNRLKKREVSVLPVCMCVRYYLVFG